MKHTSRLPRSGDETVPRELRDLGASIEALPPHLRGDLQASYQRVVESVHRRRRILLLVQEALSQLRLNVKYLMFDLEMTRKERDELREERGF